MSGAEGLISRREARVCRIRHSCTQPRLTHVRRADVCRVPGVNPKDGFARTRVASVIALDLPFAFCSRHASQCAGVERAPGARGGRVQFSACGVRAETCDRNACVGVRRPLRVVCSSGIVQAVSVGGTVRGFQEVEGSERASKRARVKEPCEGTV